MIYHVMWLHPSFLEITALQKEHALMSLWFSHWLISSSKMDLHEPLWYSLLHSVHITVLQAWHFAFLLKFLGRVKEILHLELGHHRISGSASTNLLRTKYLNLLRVLVSSIDFMNLYVSFLAQWGHRRLNTFPSSTLTSKYFLKHLLHMQWVSSLNSTILRILTSQ